MQCSGRTKSVSRLKTIWDFTVLKVSSACAHLKGLYHSMLVDAKKYP
jgi:hypothetical protein